MTEIVETLGTRDLTLAQSLRWAKRDQWEREFTRLRVSDPRRGGSDLHQSRRGGSDLAREVYQNTLREAEAGQLAVESPAEGRISDFDAELDAVLEEATRRTGVAHESELEAVRADLQARFDALQDYKAKAMGRKPKPRPAYSMKVSEAVQGFLREVGKTATKQTTGQYEASLRLFADFTGDKPIADVTRRDVASFLDEIEQFDPQWGRSPKTKKRSFEELKAMFQRTDGSIGLMNRTLNRYLTAISGAWEWAKRREEATGEDPTDGFFKPVKGRHAEPFQPYPLEMLNRLFVAPAPDNRLLWELPLVSLYSGMRLNEIASLDWRDVKDEDGIPYFDITAAKSEAGVRKVPVHNRLGWLLERREKATSVAGEGAIWPELKPGGPDGKRSWYFTKRFGVFRRERGIDGPGLKFHSFRKNAVRCLELARVPQNEAAEIVGHEKAGITYRVYNPHGLTMEQRREVVEKIEYPGLKIGN